MILLHIVEFRVGENKDSRPIGDFSSINHLPQEKQISVLGLK